MVFYRKYRPQLTRDLDSSEVRGKLQSVFLSAAPTFIQVPHAFLFTGPKGLGKTSTARIVAKVINCTGRSQKKVTGDAERTQVESIEPCNACEQCLSITNGTNLDVFEIDAASNRGIDEIRDLKEKIRLAPVGAQKKVYIIDEVHMLTTEAFNALLKTLEEPPAHAVFILCTTEAHKVPATILSRCFALRFKRATEEELVRAFKRIVKGEGLKVGDELLKKIAKLSDGGFRDGTKILEELVSLSSGQEITEEQFEKVYQLAGGEQKLAQLVASLEKKDLTGSFAVVTSLTADGTDIPYFLTELISMLHGLLLHKIGVENETVIESRLTVGQLKSLLVLFTKAVSETKYAVVVSLPLELAIITWCLGESDQRFPTQHVSGQSERASVENKTEGVSLSVLRKQAGNLAKQRAVTGVPKIGAAGGEKSEKAEPSEVSILKFAATGEHSQEWINALWKNIISEIKNYNHMIAGVLRSCRIIGYDRKVLLIEAAAVFHKEKLEEAKTFEALHKVCGELIGNPVEIKIQLRSN